ncbi:MAG: hypothetical protein ACXVAD_11270 [Syntrophales bacterium]
MTRIEEAHWWLGRNRCHRHFVFSIPKILRRYFLYDRSLLSELSCYAWESLRMFLREAVPQKGAVPGAVIAVQTSGEFLGFILIVMSFVRMAVFVARVLDWYLALPLTLEPVADLIGDD